MAKQPTLYDLLNIKPDATVEEIRRAYHERARSLHPDVDRTEGATERFLQILTAYEVLIDPQRRSNYDLTLNEKDRGEPESLQISVQYSRESLPELHEPQLVYALLKLMPPDLTRGLSAMPSRPPLNVSLVIDRSTSMQGERMDTVKAAAIEIVRQLKADDLLSIVVFSDRAEVLLPARRPSARQNVETQIRMIPTGGGTEILQGLQAALSEIRRHLSRKHINHVILLTDGRTYGDEENCLQLAEEAVDWGVGISAFGIGEEWNDRFLDDLASRTGGASYYISRPQDIRPFLQERFRALEQIYAERVKLELEVAPGVELRYAFRVQPEPSPAPIGSIFHLGSIPAKAQLSFLLEFVVPPVKASSGLAPLAEGYLSWVVPAQTDTRPFRKLVLARSVDHCSAEQPAPDELLHALSTVTLYRMQERARYEVAMGRPDQATRRLEHLATHLLSSGNEDLARAVMLEAEQIRASQSLSERGKKQIKYGTRNLIQPTGKERHKS